MNQKGGGVDTIAIGYLSALSYVGTMQDRVTCEQYSQYSKAMKSTCRKRVKWTLEMHATMNVSNDQDSYALNLLRKSPQNPSPFLSDPTEQMPRRPTYRRVLRLMNMVPSTCAQAIPPHRLIYHLIYQDIEDPITDC